MNPIDFAATLDAGKSELRAYAEARMTSRVTVRRKTGTVVQNETTGREVPVWADVHTGLPFRLDGGSTGDGGSRGVTVGGVTFEDATAVGHFPALTADLQDNDLVLVTSGEWPGTVWRIVKAVVADQKTARRLPIVGEQKPSEWA